MPRIKDEKPPSEQNELYFQNSGLEGHPHRSEMIKARSVMLFGTALDHKAQAWLASLKV